LLSELLVKRRLSERKLNASMGLQREWDEKSAE
jgi:hypothetical protein